MVLFQLLGDGIGLNGFFSQGYNLLLWSSPMQEQAMDYGGRPQLMDPNYF